MARASVWGMGTAFGYLALDIDQQAHLFCLFLAAHESEADDAGGVIVKSIGLLARAFKDGAAPESKPPTGRAERKHEPAASLPDILKPNLSAAQLAGKG